MAFGFAYKGLFQVFGTDNRRKRRSVRVNIRPGKKQSKMSHNRRQFLELSQLGILGGSSAAYGMTFRSENTTTSVVVDHFAELTKLSRFSVHGQIAIVLGAMRPFDGLGGIFIYKPEHTNSGVQQTRGEIGWEEAGWRRILGFAPEPLTAQTFGARGDISSDDTQAIQKLMEQAGTYAGDLGKAGYISSGLYRISQSLRPQSYSRLHGDGPHQTVLYNFQHPMPQTPAIATSNALTFSIFEKFGMQSQRAGFDIGGTTDHNTFRDLKVFGMADAGFRFRAPLMTSLFDRILFENCNYGLVCEDMVVNRNTFRELEFKDCASSAIKVNGAEDLLILGGRFEGRGFLDRAIVETRNVHLMTFIGGYFEGSHEYILSCADSRGIVSFDSVHFTYFRPGEAYKWNIDDGVRLVFRNCHSSIPMQVPASSILEGHNYNILLAG